jgi:hypothetical protein
MADASQAEFWIFYTTEQNILDKKNFKSEKIYIFQPMDFVNLKKKIHEPSLKFFAKSKFLWFTQKIPTPAYGF